MKIAFYEIADWETPLLQTLLPGHELSFYTEAVSETVLPEPDVDIISIFTKSKITENVLGHAKNIKCIATRTTGFDHIDLATCEKLGITVMNVPDYGQNTVAELAFGLLLMVARKLRAAANRVHQQGIFSFEGLQGVDLAGKTIGIIGTGRIGSHAARIAQGFQMKIIAYDPFPNEKLAAELGFTYVTLDELLQHADFVTIHAPYMRATHHLINKSNIGQMKSGSILINTSRGGLVETAALLEALRNGQLAGAGLDVLEEEGLLLDELDMLINGHPNAEQLKIILTDHELMHMPNVVVLPHIGFHTAEAEQRILKTTVDNITSFTNHAPQNIVKEKDH